MAARSQVRLCFAFEVALCITGLTYQSANSANQTGGATQGASAQIEGHAPPIPSVSPLADPKSLKQVGLPAEATRAAVPADNPQTPEKVALGEKLFFDGRLSADGTVACSTCHDPALAFTDGREVSIGIKGRLGQRNAPTILNALYNAAAILGWTCEDARRPGRSSHSESQ